MRRAILAVQKAEYDWQLSIFPHSIRNTHTGIQAGERGSNQCNHHGYSQDSGEGDTVPAKHLVAENLRHVTYRRARAKGSRETAATAVVIAGIDEKVRREVFEEVEDNGLDNERQKHGAWDITSGVFGLCCQRRSRFKTHYQQDGNGRLEKESTQAMRCDHTQRTGMQVMHVRMCQAISNRQGREGDEGDNLDDIDDDIGHRGAGNTDISDHANNTGKDHAHDHFLPGRAKTGDKGLDNVGDE